MLALASFRENPLRLSPTMVLPRCCAGLGERGVYWSPALEPRVLRGRIEACVLID